MTKSRDNYFFVLDTMLHKYCRRQINFFFRLKNTFSPQCSSSIFLLKIIIRRRPLIQSKTLIDEICDRWQQFLKKKICFRHNNSVFMWKVDAGAAASCGLTERQGNDVTAKHKEQTFQQLSWLFCIFFMQWKCFHPCFIDFQDQVLWFAVYFLDSFISNWEFILKFHTP